MSANKITIVIPCYWSSEELVEVTIDCFNSLSNTTDDEPSEILIINDGSPLDNHFVDETEFLQKYKQIDREKNGGYAAAVNTGLFYATGDIIIVSNNDIVFVQPDWLDQLIKPLSEGYGIASIRTSDSDGWNTEQRYEDNAKFGSIWAITREAYEKIGPLDESFGRGYFEDMDYWHRAQDAGIKITKNHAGLVEHLGRATFKTLGTESDNIYNEAMLRYAQKWDDSYLLPQNGGIVMADHYETMDMPEVARRKMRELSVTPDEARKVLGL